jgi:argininosuccinate lyase
VFSPVEPGGSEELRSIVEIDRAHLIMLAERGLVERGHAARLLRAIAELESRDFAPLAGRPPIRGLYLLYEDFLIEALGAEVGGILQTGRSRNDLNATASCLQLRPRYLRLLRELLRLEACLLARARRHAAVVMPIHTHYQAAVPVTFGHYLAGVAAAAERDAGGLLQLAAGLDTCPLGAGAAAGTTLPIDSARTAALLGFSRPVAHSLDAVASRDLALRLAGAAAVAGVTLSRVATDLLLWSSSELGFLEFPDRLVGSSSLMPQKRNAFLLEHVQGRAAAPLGAFSAAVAAMHAKPFTNSVAVGTEAVAPVLPALDRTAEAATLLRLMVAGARPCAARMLHAATASFTTATEMANRVAMQGGLAFRSAHRAVGAMVREAATPHGEPLASTAQRWLAARGLAVDVEGLDPASVVRGSEFGGGPGPRALAGCVRDLAARHAAAVARTRELRARWRSAHQTLTALATALAGEESSR